MSLRNNFGRGLGYGFSDSTSVTILDRDGLKAKAEDGTLLKFEVCLGEKSCQGCYIKGKTDFCKAETYCDCFSRIDGENGIWLKV